MVTVEVPAVAVLLAASVNALVPVVLVGLNVAVTPLGTPEADKATLPAKAFSFPTEMVLEPLAPCVTVRLLGADERLKSGAGAGAFTVRLSDVVWLKVPEVPLIVTVEVPGDAALLAASVNVLAPVVLVGLNVAVTPLGMPVAESATLPVKPLRGLTEMVLVPLAPCVTGRLLDDDERLKSAAGGGAAGDSVAID